MFGLVGAILRPRLSESKGRSGIFGPYRCDQRPDAQDIDDAFEIVGQMRMGSGYFNERREFLLIGEMRSIFSSISARCRPFLARSEIILSTSEGTSTRMDCLGDSPIW